MLTCLIDVPCFLWKSEEEAFHLVLDFGSTASYPEFHLIPAIPVCLSQLYLLPLNVFSSLFVVALLALQLFMINATAFAVMLLPW